jgi:hypothetical protein
MLKIRCVSLVVAALFISACSDRTLPPPVQYSQPPAYQQPVSQYPQQAPVVVDNSGISGTTALVGAAAVGTAAYLAGKANGQNQVTTNNTVVQPPVARPVEVTPAKPAPMVAATPTPAPAKPFEPVRVHPQPAPVVATAPAKSFTPVTVYKPATSSYSYKPTQTSSFRPASGRK